jgi:hypothetical protein
MRKPIKFQINSLAFAPVGFFSSKMVLGPELKKATSEGWLFFMVSLFLSFALVGVFHQQDMAAPKFVGQNDQRRRC